MKILVTGGAGFIGSNLIHYLLEQTPHSVVNVDKLTYAGNLDSLASVAESPRYEFAQVDIVDIESVEALFNEFRPDAVMHLAAESHVDRSIDGPGQFVQTNIVGTFNLLQAARNFFESLNKEKQGHFRFHHVSTDEVYGSLDWTDSKFSENTRYDPHSPYSASKASSDHLVRAWHATFGLPVLITNCSNNYGPYQFPEKLVPVVILKCLRGEPIPVYGKGENVRDWLYVTDHASALCRVLEQGSIGETYNIGGNNECSNLELVKLICSILDELRPATENVSIIQSGGEVSKYEQLIEFVADRPGHDLRYAIDNSKIRSQLGWEPTEDIASGFEKTIQWYLDNESWWTRILSGEYQLEGQGPSSK